MIGFVRKNMPHASDLQYFVEVARRENISRAAQTIGISQPSLSQALQRLEQNIGERLLIRHKKGVLLTRAGEEVHYHAQALLEQWADIKDKALDRIHEVQGEFVIGCHASVARTAGSYFMPQLMQDYPDLSIKFKHDLSRHITEQVIDLKIDVGIVVNPIQHPDLVIVPLAKDYISLWIHGEGEYALQNHKNGKGVIICDPALLQSQSIMKQLSSGKIKYGRVIETSDLNVVSELTAHGCGIGVMPESTAQKARAPLRRIAAAPSYDDQHCLIYRIENKSVRSIQVIGDAVKKYYQT
jgi:DNA-binding transcriptional LysR family regulator